MEAVGAQSVPVEYRRATTLGGGQGRRRLRAREVEPDRVADPVDVQRKGKGLVLSRFADRCCRLTLIGLGGGGRRCRCRGGRPSRCLRRRRRHRRRHGGGGGFVDRRTAGGSRQDHGDHRQCQSGQRRRNYHDTTMPRSGSGLVLMTPHGQPVNTADGQPQHGHIERRPPRSRQPHFSGSATIDPVNRGVPGNRNDTMVGGGNTGHRPGPASPRLKPGDAVRQGPSDNRRDRTRGSGGDDRRSSSRTNRRTPLGPPVDPGQQIPHGLRAGVDNPANGPRQATRCEAASVGRRHRLSIRSARPAMASTVWSHCFSTSTVASLSPRCLP